VDVFQAAEDLVDKGLEMGVGEGLAGSDDCCEIAFHEFCIKLAFARYVEPDVLPS
jgi:hypothetical protein